MAQALYDVVGIGNAIVDVLARVDDDFLSARGLDKGSMRLIDQQQAAELYQQLSGTLECSGGSAANTMVGLQSFGSRTAYVGKVANDTLGESFAREIREQGVHFETSPLVGGPATARCLVLVTPDAQRTMMTFLGASALLDGRDVDEDVISASRIVYLEGYLFDAPEAQEAFVKAAELAHAADRLVALTLSDSFCVERHREAFADLVKNHVDILFANESEITALYQVDFDTAVESVCGHCAIAALTRGAEGAVVISGGIPFPVPAEPVNAVIDTTGAGDLFAAGFLHGLSRGLPVEAAGRLGALASAEIIAHYGARPETLLSELL